jgi:hypothetical protein
MIIKLGNKVEALKDFTFIDATLTPYIGVPKGMTGRIIRVDEASVINAFVVRFENGKSAIFCDDPSDMFFTPKALKTVK